MHSSLPHADNPLDMAVRARDTSVLEMVRRAVDHRDVKLAVQPIVHAGNFGTAYYEGLIRVLDGMGRVIPARDFINEVENTELGRKLDCAALDAGLLCLRRAAHVQIAINVSGRSIGYRPWGRILERHLAENPDIAGRLILELSEGSALGMQEIVTAFIRRYRRQGIRFALDDFGEGLSSFKFLRDVQFDILKIDGTLIRSISQNADNQVMVQAIVQMAACLELDVVAENVETAADARWLYQAGVSYLQGYYFAAPTLKRPWEEFAP